jgi:hypothetical protein
MRQHQEHILALGRQLESHFAGVAEIEAQEARRLACRNRALDAYSFGFVLVLFGGVFSAERSA